MNDLPIPTTERLHEVARLLPQDAAVVMMALPEKAQTYMLQLITVTIDYWERMGVQLDPVQFEAIVTSVTATMAPIVRTMDFLLLMKDQPCSRCTN